MIYLMNFSKYLLDEFLGFEITSQIQDLPRCKAQKAAHRKYAEV